MKLIIRLLINTIAIVIVAYILHPHVTLTSWKSALVAGILLSLLNTLVRPIFKLLALPINLLTLGLFIFVINAFILKILDWLMKGFNISGFGWAIVAAIIISIVTTILNILIGDRKKERRRSR